MRNVEIPEGAILESPSSGASSPMQLPRLGRRFPGERAGHSLTTAHLQAAYPFMAESPLTSNGVFIGRDAYGNSFVYDPWVLYNEGHISGPNAVVIGMVGRGKSALIKTYCARQRAFGRGFWIVDPKGEFGPLAEWFGSKPIKLEPGGDLRLNPLTRRGKLEGQLSLLRSVTAAALARELGPTEDAGLRVAMVEANEKAGDRDPVLPDVVEILLHPTKSMADELVIGKAELGSQTRDAALALQRLCVGDLRGMFDGQTSEGIDLDSDAVVIDLSAVFDSQAMGIFMTCTMAWQRGILLARKERSEREGQPVKKLISVMDEAWKATSQIGIAEYLQQSFKLSRDLAVQNIIVLHRLSDLAATGAAGSRERAIAEGLLADAETKVVMAQPEDQMEATVSTLGFTGPERALIPNLGVGEALWQVGRRTAFVKHILSVDERMMIDTDRRMRSESSEQEGDR